MSYSPSVGRFLTRDPIGYVDGLNIYQMETGNPVNKVDPMGLYVINFLDFGSWSDQEIRRILDSLDRVRARCNQIYAQINAAKRRMTPCVQGQMAPELDELQKRMSDIANGIDSTTKYWALGQQALNSSGQSGRGTNASTTPPSWANIPSTILNTSPTSKRTPWTGWSDAELDSKLIHELSHVNEPGGDQDGTGHLYDPYNIENLMNKDLTHTLPFQVFLLDAQKKCKCGPSTNVAR